MNTWCTSMLEDTIFETLFRRKRPEVLVAVLQELIRRKCIDKVLTGRKETEVCSLLRFIGRNFADMNWQPVLIEVLGILIENYQDRIRNMIFKCG